MYEEQVKLKVLPTSYTSQQQQCATCFMLSQSRHEVPTKQNCWFELNVLPKAEENLRFGCTVCGHKLPLQYIM